MAKLGLKMPRLALGSLCVLLLACESSPTEPGGPVGFETVLKATLPGYAPDHLDDQGPIRDRAAWQAAWNELHGGAAPPLPEIDFRREMVVLALGPGCCGSVEILSITLESGELVVSTLVKASGNALCLAPDFSVHVVRLRRSGAGVRVEVRREDGLC
jgi:hypothetical protein